MRRTSIALIFIFLAGPALSLDNQSWWQVQELRSLNYLFTSGVLIAFNDYEADADPRRVERYREDIKTMRGLAQELGAPKVSSLIDAMDKEVRKLEAEQQLKLTVNRSGHVLAELLKLHSALDADLSSLYAGADVQSEFNRLSSISLDVGRILVLYQARTSWLLPKYAMDTSEEKTRMIDGRIQAAFQKLASEASLPAAELSSVHRKYSFVRERLVNYNQNWAPSAVGFYLDRCIRGANKLAERHK